MKNLITLIIVCLFSTNLISQTCTFVVNENAKINCNDSAMLFSTYYKTQINTMPVQVLSFVGINDSIAYFGSINSIYKTTDGGTTWNQTNFSFNAFVHFLSFPNQDTGFAMSEMGELYITNDAGQNWTYVSELTTSMPDYVSLQFVSDQTGYVNHYTDGIYKTTNGGLAWASIYQFPDLLYNIYEIPDVKFLNESLGFAIGLNNSANIILKTTDGGSTWSAFSTGSPAPILNSIYFYNEDIGFIASELGTVFTTHNGGNNWFLKQATSTPTSLETIEFYNQNIGYVTGWDGIVLKTVNGGDDWFEIETNTTNSFDFIWCIDEENHLFASQWEMLIISDINQGTFSWSPSTGLDNPSSPYPNYTSLSSIQNYTVTITPFDAFCSSSNLNVDIEIDAMDAPEICLVSVENLKNKIIWEKAQSNAIDSFYVWRETSITNVYEKIGSVAYADSSVFIDHGSYPLVKSNKYKISIYDVCDIESDKSTFPHKTMHLAINQGTGTDWNLIWEPYEGFMVSTYNIYRGTDPNTLTLIGSTSGSSSQYTDISAPAGNVYYQIEVVAPHSCFPSKSYSSSFSNISTNDPLYGLEEELQSYFFFYPNPANEYITIKLFNNIDSEILLQIYDLYGKLILSQTSISNNNIMLEVGHLKNGIYTICISDLNNFFHAQKLIISK